MSRSLVETLLGAVVLAVAIGFVVFAYTRSGVATVSGYEVSAAFNRVDGIANGSDVRIGGIKVGSVIERSTRARDLPRRAPHEHRRDGRAADGFHGGSGQRRPARRQVHRPPAGRRGDSDQADGGRIAYTQSSLLLEELIGKFAFGAE